ncbi:MAG: hypothetical protein RL311_777 [Bacteroidota bacterium]|jgi:hypothetical protein
MKYFLILFSAFTFGQASNQMITFTVAQSLGFSLNAGQSHVTSNQCMTKNDALTKYNLSASSMSAYASNQLVPRSVWVSGLPYIQYNRTSGGLLASSECSKFGDWHTIVYQQISTGRFFTNSSLTTVFNGNNYWYLFYDSVSGNTSNLNIDNSGYVSNSYDCLF